MIYVSLSFDYSSEFELSLRSVQDYRAALADEYFAVRRAIGLALLALFLGWLCVQGAFAACSR